jgi:hypothetical protein
MSTQYSSSSSHHSEKQYYLITNVQPPTTKDNEVDLQTQSWELPYTIDDADLMFDGKPLNMLYEENRELAEHETRDRGEKRGRRRSRKK